MTRVDESGDGHAHASGIGRWASCATRAATDGGPRTILGHGDGRVRSGRVRHDGHRPGTSTSVVVAIVVSVTVAVVALAADIVAAMVAVVIVVMVMAVIVAGVEGGEG